MICLSGRKTGFTLIEILLVISVIAIVTGLVLPNFQSSIHDELQSAGRVLISDLSYARSLAVTNSSQYTIRFEPSENRYILTHSGTNSALTVLPNSPFRNPDDPPEQRIVDLDELPRLGHSVRILGAESTWNWGVPISEVEFGSFGQTTDSGYTLIYLTAGSGEGQRYMLVYVDPTTGIGRLDWLTAVPPVWEN